MAMVASIREGIADIKGAGKRLQAIKAAANFADKVNTRCWPLAILIRCIVGRYKIRFAFINVFNSMMLFPTYAKVGKFCMKAIVSK